MSREDPKWSQEWSVGVRLWVERQGQAILGKGRLELLEEIDRWGSISGAARQMGMSYRRAWLLLQDINNSAGEPLAEAAVGGTHGGGARLTPRGRAAVSVFRELQRQVLQKAASVLPRLIDPPVANRLHVMAAVSLEDVLERLLTDYALQQPAIGIRAVFGGSDELADHLLSGAPGDIFLAADQSQLARLEHAGLLEPGSRTALAENTLAVIGPVDRAVLVKKPKDLLRPELRRLALAQPSCPLGKYTLDCLARLRLYDSLLLKALQLDNSRAVLAAVQAGQADAGIVYGSDAAAGLPFRLWYPFRRGSDPIIYSAAVLKRDKPDKNAAAFLRFLTSPSALLRFRQCGFLRPRSSKRE
jgi:molybdate transport system substrate-binding protein